MERARLHSEIPMKLTFDPALDGRVILAIANFDSVACRLGRATDEFGSSLSELCSGVKSYKYVSDTPYGKKAWLISIIRTTVFVNF